MESQYWNDEVQQSAWLLDYDRRCMLDCADTFQNLAAVMGEMNWELEQEKTPDDREELLRRRQAMESRKQYAAHMRQMAGMLQSVADTSVQLIRLGGRQEKQIVRALAGEGIVVEDIYLLRGKEDRLQITISVRLTKNKSMTVEEIAGYLSVLMDIRLGPQKRNPYFVGWSWLRGERGAGQRQDCRLNGADIGCGAWTGYGDAFFKWDGRRGGGRKPDGDA